MENKEFQSAYTLENWHVEPKTGVLVQMSFLFYWMMFQSSKYSIFQGCIYTQTALVKYTCRWPHTNHPSKNQGSASKSLPSSWSPVSDCFVGEFSTLMAPKSLGTQVTKVPKQPSFWACQQFICQKNMRPLQSLPPSLNKLLHAFLEGMVDMSSWDPPKILYFDWSPPYQFLLCILSMRN